VAERCDAARGQHCDDERAAGADAGVAPVEAGARRSGRLHDGGGGVRADADRIGRRRMLIAGAGLMAAAGLVFASTTNLWLLVLAGTIGVVSPSGQEVGPFLPIEQAALSQLVTDRIRTEVFAWYTLTGSVATAGGELAGRLRSSSCCRRHIRA